MRQHAGTEAVSPTQSALPDTPATTALDISVPRVFGFTIYITYGISNTRQQAGNSKGHASHGYTS